MRDLELRGAGDLLEAEQSGHVAAIGFELYVSLLEEAVEALRAADGAGAGADAQVRLDVDVDAYLPFEYIPFEAAKIGVHRRVAEAREPGELRELRDELRDRFGPVPEKWWRLLELQRARLELGRAGARTVEVRGGRLSITPLELDADQVGRLRDHIPEAMYEVAREDAPQRVPDEPEARLDLLLALTGTARRGRRTRGSTGDRVMLLRLVSAGLSNKKARRCHRPGGRAAGGAVRDRRRCAGHRRTRRHRATMSRSSRTLPATMT